MGFSLGGSSVKTSSSLIRKALICIMSAALTAGTGARAQVTATDLANSIVHLQIYEGREVVRSGSAFVVQSDRFNGYVVTNESLVIGADSITVLVPGSGGQLVAQILSSDPSSDHALLKVNGLNLPALQFSRTEPSSGEVVWSAAKLNASEKISMSKGLLRSGFRISASEPGWYQHTANLGTVVGGVLLNECGEVLGINFSEAAGDGSTRALDLNSLQSSLKSQNVNLSISETVCVSEVIKAREKAELASVEARRAKDEATKAQEVARQLESQLKASKRSSDSLVRQTELARQRADSAMAAAEQAQAKADDTSRELEEKTLVLREETQAMLRAFEKERLQTEERFQDLLASQEAAAESRERTMTIFMVVMIVLIIAVVILSRTMGRGDRIRKSTPVLRSDEGNTEVHREELAEYVLDGRDEDGIRYLLRISGDQMVDDTGVVIGRNPKDSPYIINHADVSRKHARLKVMKNRVFIEDLGSTNGTSVNGQSIDDKGLVSVDNGDQIIIGSVVMKLRVMEG
jgi:hypothetical protein